MACVKHTVGDVLCALNMVEYSHVCIQQKTDNGVMPLGGGSPSSVYLRFGGLPIRESRIERGILFIIVGN